MREYIDILRKEYVVPIPINKTFSILLFSYLTFCGAMIKIYVPFTPVPFTLQNFVLFISIYYLGSKEVGISQLLYILLGFIGAPVFAVGLSGIAIFIGPTAGYLIGFVVSGFLMAFFYNKIKRKNYFNRFLTFWGGALLILLFGTLHLAFIYGLGLKKAFIIGFLPFLIPDTFKALVAALFYKIIK